MASTPFVLTLGSPPTRPLFRRVIRLRGHCRPNGDARSSVLVRAALEDDFHHFRVELVVADGRIGRVAAQTPRHPYSLCPSAGDALQALVGLEPSRHAHALAQAVEQNEQCTHLLDLAGLAGALAVRGIAERRYDIDVAQRQAGRTQARLARDGTDLLCWEVQDLAVIGPDPYSGLDLRKGMARWALGHLPEEQAEAVLVLRRCAAISMGKGLPLDDQPHAQPTGRCYAQQPRRAPSAIRQVGSTLDFTARAAELCADDEAWLDARD